MAASKQLTTRGELDTVLLPELTDAQVIWAEDNRMRVRGTERIEGAYYAQTWDIKVL